MARQTLINRRSSMLKQSFECLEYRMQRGYTVRLEGSKNDGDDTYFDASNEESALSVLLACPASLVIFSVTE